MAGSEALPAHVAIEYGRHVEPEVAMRLSCVLILCSLAIGPAFAETNALPAEITVDGVTYEGVRWGTVTPVTVSIFHKTGVATISLEKLPPELQKQFRYDPVKAADYTAAQQRAEAARQEALQKRRAEDAVERQRQAKEQAEKQKQAAADAAAAKQAADAEAVQYGPVTMLKYTYAYDIKARRDGTYEANLFYHDDLGDLRSLYVTFPAAGLNFLRNMRNSNVAPNSRVIYGRPYEANLVNAFGGSAGDTAYWLVGIRTDTKGYPLW